MKKILFKWTPAIIMLTFIYFISSLSGEVINSNGLGNEALHINGHFMMFVFLYLSLYKGLEDKNKAFFISFLYSIFDEFHQKFVPGRNAGMFDIMVDNLGILLGYLGVWKLYPLLPNKLKNLLSK